MTVDGKLRRGWTQVSRLGNPLVNEVVVPTPFKDVWNRSAPVNDKQFAGPVVKPVLAKLMNDLYKLNAPEDNRDDLVAVFGTGVKGLNFTGNTVADMLRLNYSIPVTPAGKVSRMGVIGGDNGGFPNGRRLGDDVIDIAEQVMAGFLKGNKVPLGDGVNSGDVPALDSFPYEADPAQAVRQHEGAPEVAPAAQVSAAAEPLSGRRRTSSDLPLLERKEKGMRWGIALAALIAAVLTAFGLARAQGPATATASSHREAPVIADDPAADNTDLYAFRSPDRPNTVTLVANYIPLEEPAGGPNFAKFDDSVLYELNVDSDGDAQEDLSYRFRFTTTVGNGNTFLYNTGPVTSLDDPDLNVRQTYTVTRVTGKGKAEVLGSGIPTPPVNIGPALDTGLRRARGGRRP